MSHNNSNIPQFSGAQRQQQQQGPPQQQQASLISQLTPQQQAQLRAKFMQMQQQFPNGAPQEVMIQLQREIQQQAQQAMQQQQNSRPPPPQFQQQLQQQPSQPQQFGGPPNIQQQYINSPNRQAPPSQSPPPQLAQQHGNFPLNNPPGAVSGSGQGSAPSATPSPSNIGRAYPNVPPHLSQPSSNIPGQAGSAPNLARRTSISQQPQQGPPPHLQGPGSNQGPGGRSQSPNLPFASQQIPPHLNPQQQAAFLQSQALHQKNKGAATPNRGQGPMLPGSQPPHGQGQVPQGSPSLPHSAQVPGQPQQGGNHGPQGFQGPRGSSQIPKGPQINRIPPSAHNPPNFLPDQQQHQQHQQQHQQQQPQQSAPAPALPSHGQTQLPSENLELSTPEEILEVLKELPPPTDVETSNVEKYLARDSTYEQHMDYVHDRFSRIIKRKRTELQYFNQVLAVRQQQPGSLFSGGYMGYGNGWTGNKFDLEIIYPKKRKRNNRISTDCVLSQQQLDSIAEHVETLVPIRLDIEMDKYRLRDTFIWNLKEDTIPISTFAENLVEDFHLPLSLASNVTQAMTEQIKDFVPHNYVDISEPKYANSNMYRDEDLRINIKLDITVGQHNLVDQFEWDINCAENCPEAFAETMCKELGLSGEFMTAIAHSIREQQELFTKTLHLIQYSFDGTPIEDEDLRREFNPPITMDYLRNKSHLKEYSPAFFEISEMELDRQDRDRDRDSRRKRRQGRAGRRNGPSLPDFRESLRSFRTPIYSTTLPGGLDRNVEFMRRMRQEEAADNDEAAILQMSGPGGNITMPGMYAGGIPGTGMMNAGSNMVGAPGGVGFGVSSRGRVRIPGYMAPGSAGTSSHSGTASPKPVGRPPLNRNNSSIGFHGAGAYARGYEESPQPPSRFIVVLKVPRLRRYLSQIQRTSFS